MVKGSKWIIIYIAKKKKKQLFMLEKCQFTGCYELCEFTERKNLLEICWTIFYFSIDVFLWYVRIHLDKS